MTDLVGENCLQIIFPAFSGHTPLETKERAGKICSVDHDVSIQDGAGGIGAFGNVRIGIGPAEAVVGAGEGVLVVQSEDAGLGQNTGGKVAKTDDIVAVQGGVGRQRVGECARGPVGGQAAVGETNSRFGRSLPDGEGVADDALELAEGDIGDG
jgi:hypothetical protein